MKMNVLGRAKLCLKDIFVVKRSVNFKTAIIPLSSKLI